MKKGNCQERKNEDMTEYEKNRLNKLKLNAARMEAAGFGSLVNKILQSKCDSAAKKVVPALDDMLDGDGDEEYQPSDNEDGEEETNVLQNSAPPKKGLRQQTTMLQLAMTRSRKKISSNQQPRTVEKKDGEGKMDLLQNSTLIHKDTTQKTMVDLAMSRARKKMPPTQHQNPQNKPIVESMQQKRKSVQESTQISIVETMQQKRKSVQESTQILKRVRSDPKGQQASEQQALQLRSNKSSEGKSDKQIGLLRTQFCPPGSLAKYIQLKQRHANVGILPSLGLPPTSLDGYEVDDNLLNSTQVNQDTATGTMLDVAQTNAEFPLEASMDDQHESHFEPIEENQLDSTPKDSTPKKHRGATLMSKVYHRPQEERRVIILDENGQPIAPKDALVELRNFLGTLAKNHEYAPLNILDWKYMPTKELIWSFVKEKFIIPEEGKGYVLGAVNTDWRTHKCRMKSKHYKAYETYEDRWNNRPASIPEIQFKELLEYWDSPVGQDMAAINTSNRQKHEDVHTLGPCSLARLRYELEKKDPNKEPPVEWMIYQESRKRDPKRSYKTSGVKTKTNIEKMDKIQLEIEKGDKSNNVDPYYEVVKQHSGRAFLQGRGVKVSRSKGKEKKGGYIMDQAFFQHMKAEWTQEVTANLASKILSHLQAANPHMKLVIPDFTAIGESSEQVTKGENLQNDENPAAPQEHCEGEEDDVN